MANKPKRRKFRKYLKGQIDNAFNLGTLAANTLIGDDVDDVLTEKAYLSSVKATWTLSAGTAGPTVGPVLVGVAHSDYSDAEIEAWIENVSGWEEFNEVQQEIAKRKIRRVGILKVPETASLQAELNDGKPITTKCGWMLGTGQTVRIWAYNMGVGAFATTDPVVHTQGHANLWPR